MDDLKLDILNSWSQSKLKILEKYANVYTKVVTTGGELRPHYIDAFSGAGKVIIKDTGLPAKGSPLIALQFNFASYYFIEKNKSKIANVKKICKEKYPDKYKEIYLKCGDCNEIIPEILSKMSWENYDRVLCFVDPYGLTLSWNLIEKIAAAGGTKEHEKIGEMILNFPTMAINRNALRNKDKKESVSGKKNMGIFWGYDEWELEFFKESKQLDSLKGKGALEKISNEEAVNLFIKKLKDEAKFKYVLEPIPMKNSKNAILYYIIFATQNKKGKDVMESVIKAWKKRNSETKNRKKIKGKNKNSNMLLNLEP